MGFDPLKIECILELTGVASSRLTSIGLWGWVVDLGAMLTPGEAEYNSPRLISLLFFMSKPLSCMPGLTNSDTDWGLQGAWQAAGSASQESDPGKLADVPSASRQSACPQCHHH